MCYTKVHHIDCNHTSLVFHTRTCRKATCMERADKKYSMLRCENCSTKGMKPKPRWAQDTKTKLQSHADLVAMLGAADIQYLHQLFARQRDEKFAIIGDNSSDNNKLQPITRNNHEGVAKEENAEAETQDEDEGMHQEMMDKENNRKKDNEDQQKNGKGKQKEEKEDNQKEENPRENAEGKTEKQTGEKSEERMNEKEKRNTKDMDSAEKANHATRPKSSGLRFPSPLDLSDFASSRPPKRETRLASIQGSAVFYSTDDEQRIKIPVRPPHSAINGDHLQVQQAIKTQPLFMPNAHVSSVFESDPFEESNEDEGPIGHPKPRLNFRPEVFRPPPKTGHRALEGPIGGRIAFPKLSIRRKPSIISRGFFNPDVYIADEPLQNVQEDDEEDRQTPPFMPPQILQVPLTYVTVPEMVSIDELATDSVTSPQIPIIRLHRDEEQNPMVIEDVDGHIEYLHIESQKTASIRSRRSYTKYVPEQNLENLMVPECSWQASKNKKSKNSGKQREKVEDLISLQQQSEQYESSNLVNWAPAARAVQILGLATSDDTDFAERDSTQSEWKQLRCILTYPNSSISHSENYETYPLHNTPPKGLERLTSGLPINGVLRFDNSDDNIEEKEEAEVQQHVAARGHFAEDRRRAEGKGNRSRTPRSKSDSCRHLGEADADEEVIMIPGIPIAPKPEAIHFGLNDPAKPNAINVNCSRPRCMSRLSHSVDSQHFAAGDTKDSDSDKLVVAKGCSRRGMYMTSNVKSATNLNSARLLDTVTEEEDDKVQANEEKLLPPLPHFFNGQPPTPPISRDGVTRQLSSSIVVALAASPTLSAEAPSAPSTANKSPLSSSADAVSPLSPVKAASLSSLAEATSSSPFAKDKTQGFIRRLSLAAIGICASIVDFFLRKKRLSPENPAAPVSNAFGAIKRSNFQIPARPRANRTGSKPIVFKLSANSSTLARSAPVPINGVARREKEEKRKIRSKHLLTI